MADAAVDAGISDNEHHDTAGETGADDTNGGDLRDTVEEAGLEGEVDDDDLFGDGGDDNEEQPAPLRQLDDEDLDSGDDAGRNDRRADTQEDAPAEDEHEEALISFMDADIARHPIPEPSDGELYSLKVPRFLEFEPVAWDHKKFQPPTTDHHSNVASEHFSAYDTAMTTIRWRRSPSKPDELQSNARILRWSDGSLTLQLASQPLEQYELDAKLDAPAKVNPKKPTPRSALLKAGQNVKESYTYLAAPYHTASVVRVTNKITTRLAVIPTSTSKDSAIEMLQSALAKAANRTLDSKEQAISFINVDEDPELVRQRREAEFKQKQKAQRAKEKNEMKEREKQTRRMGGGRSAGYGLSIGGLEDEEGGRRGGVRRPRAKTGLRRDWSDDEDYGIRGKTREDEYDEEDDFIAASDEEEVVEDDEDDDDGIVESPPRRRQETQSPKRGRAGDNEDVVVSRTKRRRVVEDDDEDE